MLLWRRPRVLGVGWPVTDVCGPSCVESDTTTGHSPCLSFVSSLPLPPPLSRVPDPRHRRVQSPLFQIRVWNSVDADDGVCCWCSHAYRRCMYSGADHGVCCWCSHAYRRCMYSGADDGVWAAGFRGEREREGGRLHSYRPIPGPAATYTFCRVGIHTYYRVFRIRHTGVG
jgi:hypothetical protein